MPDKFQNKYRIPSTRLQNWDYSSNAAYFITICTKNRKYFFGEIINKEMQLNDIGKVAEQFWLEIPNHFPFIELRNFVVMPNHMHGILIIDKPDKANNKNVVGNKSAGQQRFQNQQGYHFIYCGFVQIRGIQKCTFNNFGICMAIPFSRPYHSQCGIV